MARLIQWFLNLINRIAYSPRLGLWSVLSVAPVGVFGTFLLVQYVSSFNWPAELRGDQLSLLGNIIYIILGGMILSILLVGGLIRSIRFKAGGNELEVEGHERSSEPDVRGDGSDGDDGDAGRSGKV